MSASVHSRATRCARQGGLLGGCHFVAEESLQDRPLSDLAPLGSPWTGSPLPARSSFSSWADSWRPLGWHCAASVRLWPGTSGTTRAHGAPSSARTGLFWIVPARNSSSGASSPAPTRRGAVPAARSAGRGRVLLAGVLLRPWRGRADWCAGQRLHQPIRPGPERPGGLPGHRVASLRARSMVNLGAFGRVLPAVIAGVSLTIWASMNLSMGAPGISNMALGAAGGGDRARHQHVSDHRRAAARLRVAAQRRGGAARHGPGGLHHHGDVGEHGGLCVDGGAPGGAGRGARAPVQRAVARSTRRERVWGCVPEWGWPPDPA